MRVGSTEFDPVIVGAMTVVGVVAVGVVFGLRDVLVRAPGAAFPLLFGVLFGGMFVVAWLVKRRR